MLNCRTLLSLVRRAALLSERTGGAPKQPSKQAQLTYPSSKIVNNWGAWVVRSVECLTRELSSGLDLGVVSSSPELGSELGTEPTDKQTNKT